jgi:hypothetical protein
MEPAAQVRATSALGSRNYIAYQDEMTPLIGFAVTCLAQAMPAAADFWEGLKPADRTPVRQQGLAKMRNGIVEIYGGAIKGLSDPSMRAGNRKILLDAVSGSAVDLASVLNPAQRKQVISLVELVMATASPAYKGGLSHIRQVMSTAPCNSLCKV